MEAALKFAKLFQLGDMYLTVSLEYSPTPLSKQLKISHLVSKLFDIMLVSKQQKRRLVGQLI